jgi:co-chaperonin GroES (HSP10)
MNKSGINPVGYNVLVKPEEVEKTTKGGIILPETKLEKDEFGRMEGQIVAVSPMAFTFKDWPVSAPKPQVGQRVIFSRYAGSEVTGRDGAKYWLMKDESIAGVMTDD